MADTPSRAEMIALVKRIAKMFRREGALFYDEQDAATLDAIAQELERQDASIRKDEGPSTSGLRHPAASVPIEGEADDTKRLDTAIVDAIEADRDLLAYVRGGVNRIGVRTGGWLWCRRLDGSEEWVSTFREAIQAVAKEHGKPLAALRSTPKNETK